MRKSCTHVRVVTADSRQGVEKGALHGLRSGFVGGVLAAGQFRPDSVPVIRAQVPAHDLAFRGQLDLSRKLGASNTAACQHLIDVCIADPAGVGNLAALIWCECFHEPRF